jgi:hypothetical protein
LLLYLKTFINPTMAWSSLSTCSKFCLDLSDSCLYWPCLTLGDDMTLCDLFNSKPSLGYTQHFNAMTTKISMWLT